MTREEAKAELTCILNHEGEYMDYLTAIEVEAIKTLAEERYGEWVVSEVRCPNCLEYFDTDCYSKEEMRRCPNCGADMREVSDD